VKNVVGHMPEARGCACGSALRHAILTDKAMIPAEVKDRLGLLIGKYLGA
jgi:5'-methylthioadenosine phosphorylase